MDRLLRIYRTFNLLSLDVAVGAVISALYFSKLLSVKPNVYSMITLGLTVWIIYTADRLLDVRNLKKPATDRHKFHQRYQNQLWSSTFIAGLIVASLVFFLPSLVFMAGSLLAAISGLYLLTQKYLRAKELVVAILYTVGVLLPSCNLSTEPLSSEHHLLIVQFFIVALINLLLFSWFEYEADKNGGYSSFVTTYGKKLTVGLLLMLSFCNASITGWMLVQNPGNVTALVFLIMTSILLIIYLFPVYFAVNSRYRLVGDAVFFLPLVGLI
jgi:hypothetical protein